MSITYTWEVTSLNTKTEGDNSDAVVQTFWKKIGTDENGNRGIFNGATPFSSVNTDDFVAFADLTEEIVLEWIQAKVVGEYEKHVNGSIQKQIDYLANPDVIAQMPWAEIDDHAPLPVDPAMQENPV